MILYKYYNAENGLKAIESCRLGFRNPKYFNDPFELTSLSNAEGHNKNLKALKVQVEILKEHVCILSLSRNPMNPLMWSHYGSEHTGIVIGYEVSGDFLNNPSYSLIPVDAGDVIYSHTKSPFTMTTESMKYFSGTFHWGLGYDEPLSYEQQVIARRLFLTKHASWVYEEEVRVVKSAISYYEEVASFQSNPLRKIIYDKSLPNGLHLYDYKVPIREIYLGARSQTLFSWKNREKINSAKCPIYQLRVDDASWELNKDILINLSG